jgi:phenylalanine-4-hydroxylase
MLPKIWDDVIKTMIGLTQGSMSYANYTQQLNDFLWRSRQPLTDDFQCARFINGLANFQLHNEAKSHRSLQKGLGMPVVEL